MLLMVVLYHPLPGQERKRLEAEREQLLQEIKATNQQLAATQKDRANALNNYLLVKKQVENRRELIRVYEEDIERTAQNIERTEEVVGHLSEDLSTLRQEYQHIMQAALRSKLQQSYLVFLFSSESLNDAFRRLQYLRQYDKYRQRQSRLIRSTQESLETKVSSLQEEKAQQEKLLEELLLQSDQLSSELKSKNRLLNSLQSAERKLAASLEKKEKAARKLDQAIEAVIQKEIAAASAREEVSSEVVANTSVETGNFVQGCGRLPWPVGDGTIVRNFGINRHPTYKNVKTSNNGVDIRTSQPESVKAVFAGTVVGVQFIPGFKNTVIIKHGTYYTVYSNLVSVYVKKEDAITARQEIGKLSTNEPEIHFEVWRGKERLDPEKWIQRK
jgi:septal ring factor EnvC (AmiA/AmiB activator)